MLKFLNRYRQHIIIMASVVAVLVQATVFLISDYEDLKSDIDVGENYFNSLIEQRFHNLQQNAKLVSNDHAFKAAVSTFEEKTVRYALLNHQTRLSSDIMAIIDPNDDFFASTEGPEKNRELGEALLPVKGLIHQDQYSEAIAIIEFNGKIYQVALVPLLAPRIIAYFLVGHQIDNTIAEQTKDITSLEITFIAEQISDEDENTINIAATTLNAHDLDVLKRHIRHERSFVMDALEKVISETILIKQDNQSVRFTAFLKKPWSDILNKYTVSIFYVIFICSTYALRFSLRYYTPKEAT